MKTFEIEDGSKVFFTSDTHFGHNAIINFGHRKYKDVEEMNNGIIQNWNSVVKKDDFIFHLGDFAFGGSDLWINTLKQLNGNIILIKGNHDIKNYRDNYDKFFTFVDNELFIRIGGQSIYLNHYPFLTFAGIFRDNNPTWQLFGHVHLCPKLEWNNGRDFDRMKYLLPTQYEVGCDLHNYTPISFDFIKERIDYQVKNNVNVLHWIK